MTEPENLDVSIQKRWTGVDGENLDISVYQYKRDVGGQDLITFNNFGNRTTVPNESQCINTKETDRR